MMMNEKAGSEDRMGRKLGDPLCICLLAFLRWNVVVTSQPFGEKSDVFRLGQPRTPHVKKRLG
jgi:hypothetical protein